MSLCRKQKQKNFSINAIKKPILSISGWEHTRSVSYAVDAIATFDHVYSGNPMQYLSFIKFDTKYLRLILT